MAPAGFTAGLAGLRTAMAAGAAGWMRRSDNAGSGSARGTRTSSSAASAANVHARRWPASCTTNGRTTGRWSRTWSISGRMADRSGCRPRRSNGRAPTAAPKPSGFRSPVVAASPWKRGTCRRAKPVGYEPRTAGPVIRDRRGRGAAERCGRCGRSRRSRRKRPGRQCCNARASPGRQSP